MAHYAAGAASRPASISEQSTDMPLYSRRRAASRATHVIFEARRHRLYAAAFPGSAVAEMPSIISCLERPQI